MAQHKIVTGEYVTLRQTPASMGDRIMARLIDSGILVLAFITFGVIISVLSNIIKNNNVYAIVVYTFLIIIMLYDFWWEVFNDGRSVGKMVMNIKVVHVDGTPATVGSYLIRWVLATIDIGLGLGLLSIIFTRNNQRLGDLAAGTTVVKLLEPSVDLDVMSYGYTVPDYVPTYPEAALLNMNQASLIDRVLRLNDWNRRHDDIMRLALKVQQTLGIIPTTGTQEQFLEVILNDYYHYSTTLEV